MKGAWAVFRREFAAHFDSLVAPVTTLLFVLALDGLFFTVGYAVGDTRLPAFWTGRVASLRALFLWLPLLFVVLVPALTMGAWAEERRSGTEELLLSLPLRPREAVLGKFLSSWLLLILLLVVAVLPVAVVVSRLGPLDWGTVWGGLAGAALLGGAWLSLGLWISALSSDQLLAFLVSAVLLALLWSLDLVARLLPAGLADALHAFSPTAHFLEGGALGVFDLGDAIYFLLLILVGLVLNTTAVEGRRWRGGRAS